MSEYYNNQPGYNQNQPGYNNQPGYSQNQPSYQQPSQQYQDPAAWPHMRLRDWIVTQLMLLIPIANIVFIFMWAFGKDVNPSKKSYFQATLIWFAVAIVITILMSIFMVSLFSSIFSGFANYYY
ncbi:MAG: hypothetical protein FWH57_06720 [Oscillospiraceae bacterium]|nr:hypothetical protein [Oscillospiraceae bacterium]